MKIRVARVVAQKTETQDAVRATGDAAIQSRAVVVIREVLGMDIEVADNGDEVRTHVFSSQCCGRALWLMRLHLALLLALFCACHLRLIKYGRKYVELRTSGAYGTDSSISNPAKGVVAVTGAADWS
jgi:hypothetical protein